MFLILPKKWKHSRLAFISSIFPNKEATENVLIFVLESKNPQEVW